jgi:hypothetical protein|nr:MAG TPA: Interferon-inducible and double-stranded-dependent eIF-2kinase dna binding protein, helix [Caudoviricetes sp.]
MSNKFTEQDVAQLVQLWNANLTARDIAAQMERPFHNIRNKIKSLQRQGVISPRSKTNVVDDTFISITAGTYQLPIELVEYFTTLFSGGQERVIAGTQQCCEAYQAQGGYCYYLRGQVKLTTDNSPSGVVPMQGPGGGLILVCNAIAGTRKTMSHEGFIALCKVIAQNFPA